MTNANIRQLEIDGKVFYPQTDIHGLVNNGAYAIDDEPTQGSSNLVTSDGVYSVKSETLEENRQMVNSIMEDYAPVEIHGDVTNAADEEDLTSINVEGTDVLKFKDKVYNPIVYSGLGKKILRKNMINGVNTLTQSMINDANTIYVIKYDFTFGENITVPAGCVLEFDGGSISGAYAVTGIILNDIVKPDWFGAAKDGVTDCSQAVQNALNVCKVGGTVLFSNGSYAFRNVTIRRNCIIKGSHESILIGQRLTEGLSGLDYLFKSDGVDEIYLEGFKVTAVPPAQQQEVRVNPSNPLFYLKNGKNVLLNNVFFDSVKPRRCEKVPYYTDGIVLYSIVDFDETIITNCIFKDCAWSFSYEEERLSFGGEMTLIVPIEKDKIKTKVIYSNNHVYNTTLGGCSVFTLECGTLIFDNNLIENIVYGDDPNSSELYGGGSILNLFGIVSTITNNTIRNCLGGSVFDICEGGGFYSDKVYVLNNNVECYNSIMIKTTSRVVEVKDNTFKGFSLIMEDSYTDDKSGIYPINDFVNIENNTIDCDYYDLTLGKGPNGKHGIGVGVETYFAKTISIKNNTIKYTYNANLPGDVKRRRKVINVINCKNLEVVNNYINGTLPPERNYNSGFLTYLYITTVKLKGYTYNNDPTIIEQVVVTNNVIKDSTANTNYFISIQLDEDGTTEQLDHFDYMDIKNLIVNSSDDTGYQHNMILCSDNVGIKNGDVEKRYFKDNIYCGYNQGDNEPNTNKYHISCIQKGHELIDQNTNNIHVAVSDTCIPDYDSVSDLGATTRIGAVVSFGNTNWQVLKDVVIITSDMGPGNSGTVGEISVFGEGDNKVAWRRCPDSRNNFITLNELVNEIESTKTTLLRDDFVDLGLPSGTLWAKTNIGAINPEDYGLYFTWGNPEGHSYNSGYDFTLASYSSTLGASLNSNIPLSAYDMARRNYGTPAKLPTRAQFDELVDNCTTEWVTVNNITGRRFTSNNNGNSIFIPTCGRGDGTAILSEDKGYYWASDIHSNANSAYCMFFGNTSIYPHTDGYRYNGFNVRAVV